MSPALRGEKIPLGTGQMHARIGEAGDGEVHVECPVDGCDWTTIRPVEYAASAREAHAIGHQKGWFA